MGYVGNAPYQGVVDTGNIADNSVTTSKIAPDTVVAADIAPGAVGASELASGAAVANIGYTPLNPANNLSEVTAATARTNLGLGTAATTNSTAYATAAQGTKADSALQPAAIGVTVQGYSASTVVDASYVHTDNNYTTAEKSKLAGIAAGAEVNVNADWTAASGDAQILNKPTLGTLSSLSPSGTASSSTFLRGDNSWQTVSVPVTSVAGRTGDVVLAKSDVGLSNVANVDTTNASNISSGTLGKPRLPSGSVLQVVQVVSSTTWVITSGTDIEVLAASITPQSTTSKILVNVSLCHAKSDGYTGYTKLKRNGTWVFPNTSQYGFPVRNVITTWGADTYNFSYLDSPSTTSSVTYGVTTYTSGIVDGQGGSYPMYVNRSRNDYDGRSGGQASSTITLIEVAA